MPEETNPASVSEQSSTVTAPDWSLLDELSNNQEVKIESPKVETPEQKTNTDVITDEQVKDDGIKIEVPEEKKEEKKEETPAATETPEVNPLFEIKPEDLTDVPKTFEEGTFQALAKDGWGIELKEESFDAFKENFVPKAELEKVTQMTKESILAEYSPETAATIQLLELGLPQELILEPTRNVDNNVTIIDNAVKLGDAELVRAELENTEGWTPEMIDTEIEELVANGKIAHKAQVVRVNLLNDKKVLLAQREDILKTRNDLIAKHTTDKQRVAEQKKEQDNSLFLKALNDKSDFMGVPIPKDFKDAVALKFRSGLYDSKLSEAQTKVNSILFAELGSKFADLVKKSAFAKGKETEIKKNANIPPISSAASGQRVINKEPSQDKENDFSIIQQDFGNK